MQFSDNVFILHQLPPSHEVVHAEIQETSVDTHNKPDGSQNQTQGFDMIYKIEDVPPWYLCMLLGLQVHIFILLTF